ncbi:MAG TPA: 3-hydroxyacyl-CoA dehydrogenase family protein [Chthoniobacteraceae bacterium]|nr:3-hydroxyacyl-CoA dehydrogenase family protein [Chthoniobacteraceae bacterium]
MNTKPTIFVAGAGLMGHGIAQTAATAGHPVLLYDLSPEAVERGLRQIAWSLEKFHAKAPEKAPDPQEVLARITPTTELERLAEAGVVIEAIIEKAAQKEAFFSRAEEVSSQETVFCSNTSAIPISQLAAATRRPDRFCGMHFFNPVPLMKLVEVIRGIDTSAETVERVVTLARDFGKEPVVVERDTAGFIVNRILIASLLEAVRVLEAGLADAEQIDAAMRLGCGHRMGPLETADLSGLDVFLHAANAIHEDTGDPKFKAPPLLARLVAAGHLGRKTGRGFYRYPREGAR